MKTKDWRELTSLTKGSAVIVERGRMPENGIAIEGAFELPVLARLSEEDLGLIMAFVRGVASMDGSRRRLKMRPVSFSSGITSMADVGA